MQASVRAVAVVLRLQMRLHVLVEGLSATVYSGVRGTCSLAQAPPPSVAFMNASIFTLRRSTVALAPDCGEAGERSRGADSVYLHGAAPPLLPCAATGRRPERHARRAYCDECGR